MPWITAGATLLGGLIGNRSANSAADAQRRASEAAIAEQRRQFDTARGDQQPYMQQGVQANAWANRALGGDYSGFENAPDYQYTLGQMIQGKDRSAASRGSLYSGGHQLDLAANINGLAAQNFGNYWARLAGQQQLGQAAASGVGALGANMANQVGGQYGAIGGAQGNAALQQGANWQNAIGQLGSAFSSSYGAQQQAPAQGGYGAPGGTNQFGMPAYNAGAPNNWGSWYG